MHTSATPAGTREYATALPNRETEGSGAGICVWQDAGIALKLLTAEQFDEWVQPERMTNSPAFEAVAKL